MLVMFCHYYLQKSYYDKDKEQILTTKLVVTLDYKFT